MSRALLHRREKAKTINTRTTFSQRRLHRTPIRCLRISQANMTWMRCLLVGNYLREFENAPASFRPSETLLERQIGTKRRLLPMDGPDAVLHAVQSSRDESFCLPKAARVQSHEVADFHALDSISCLTERNGESVFGLGLLASKHACTGESPGNRHFEGIKGAEPLRSSSIRQPSGSGKGTLPSSLGRFYFV
jgi:hypothetical protein